MKLEMEKEARQVHEVEQSRYKIYVEVNAYFSTDGEIIPRSILWEDGRVFEIQRITDIRRAANLRAGGTGIRFTCIIEGAEKHLYYENGRKWFVEAL